MGNDQKRNLQTCPSFKMPPTEIKQLDDSHWENKIVKILVYYKGNLIFRTNLPALSDIQDVIHQINEIIPDKIKIKPYMHIQYLYKDHSIDRGQFGVKIKDLFTVMMNSPELTINITVTGLPIPKNWKENYSAAQTYIGKPLKDREILIYTRNPPSMNLCSKFKRICTRFSISNGLKSSFYSHGTAYCNGMNFLYLSGGKGDYEEDPEDVGRSFTMIDLKRNTYNIMKDVLKYPRSQHSMICIPTSFVFIIGGKTKVVEFFDAENERSYVHSELNDERREPGLAFVDNSVLYAIEGRAGILNEYTFNFEKINLTFIDSKWENKTLICSYKLSFDCRSSYGISSYGTKKELIIFHPINEDNCTSNFIWNYETDTINPSVKVVYAVGGNEKIHFGKEKFFFPFDVHENIHIPDVTNEEELCRILISTPLVLGELTFGTYNEMKTTII